MVCIVDKLVINGGQPFRIDVPRLICEAPALVMQMARKEAITSYKVYFNVTTLPASLQVRTSLVVPEYYEQTIQYEGQNDYVRLLVCLHHPTTFLVDLLDVDPDVEDVRAAILNYLSNSFDFGISYVFDE